MFSREMDCKYMQVEVPLLIHLPENGICLTNSVHKRFSSLFGLLVGSRFELIDNIHDHLFHFGPFGQASSNRDLLLQMFTNWDNQLIESLIYSLSWSLK